MKLSKGILVSIFTFLSVAAHAQNESSKLSISVRNDLHEMFFASDRKATDRQILRRGKIKNTDDLARILESMGPQFVGDHFKVYGEMGHFKHTPQQYGVDHGIAYYVPRTYNPDQKTPALVLLHGGGGTTNTYDNALDAAKMYMEEFIPFAEANSVILIVPSSQLGWNYITRILVPDVIDIAKQELNLDTNKIYLWGHSMGGMGTVREAHWLVNWIAAASPNAAGMQDQYRIEPFLKTYFNLPMTHMQGLNDHFQPFVTRTRDVVQKMNALEDKLGQPSKYKAIFEDRYHDHDIVTVVKLLEQEFLKIKRDLYQPKIYALFERVDAANNPLGPNLVGHTQSYYLWLEAPNILEELPRKEFEEGSGENFVAVEAAVANNVYTITMADPRIKKLRVLVSSKMVDLSKPVEVMVNGNSVFKKVVKSDAKKALDIARERKDPKVIFDNAIELELK